MTTPKLQLPDLVEGLERFGDRYQSIDVFADDLFEANSNEQIEGLFKSEKSNEFIYVRGGRTYLLEVFV